MPMRLLRRPPSLLLMPFFPRSSGAISDHLAPPPSPYPATVEPSPVDSNGTNGTEIEDDEQIDEADDEHDTLLSPGSEDLISPLSHASRDGLAKVHSLATVVQSEVLIHVDHEDPHSVACTAPIRLRRCSTICHSRPEQLQVLCKCGPRPLHDIGVDSIQTRNSVSAASSHTASDHTAVVSPQTPEANMLPDDKVRRAHVALEQALTAEQTQHASPYTHPIDTTVTTSGAPDRTTPRAQTRDEYSPDGKRRSRVSLSLADIAESDDSTTHDGASAPASETDGSLKSSPSHTYSQSRKQPSENASSGVRTMGDALRDISDSEKEVIALRSALNECWTLCNTLAKLSQGHRQKIFHYSGGPGEIQQQAWKTCWRLCQRLYESRDDDHTTHSLPILELCRDFCQALFEVRHRSDETADSVLRVSFELNNHLYNAHDRSLPEAFRERTLDFYVTLCHRLMKQNTSLPEETDALLHACWSLAEMLFSIRQNSRDGKPADEELLGSAIQACWELCDMFRDGWTQVRPDRGTPRPAQYAFARPASSLSRSQVSHSERSEMSSHLTGSYHSAISMRRQIPETPTTIFDDREEFSPTEEESVPNILVLGPEAGQTRTHDRWSSTSSNLSTYSDTSVHTSSTATASREDPNLLRLRALITKAAVNSGYNRQIPLQDFVRTLPSNSFGTVPWQTSLLDNYKRLVLSDPTLHLIHNQPLRRYTANEIGRAVQWLGKSDQFSWMRDLYRFVFGNFPEDLAQHNLVISA
ncbi:hypothetical protein M011DRAFT_455337 [Sporormia fimetaria CBS 119925]|uniref:DUF7624 domain-containing protein n=1 Tax=Sporormia fimetaria CBS 119925 TaxID=1340428 RepID=A0A6A6VNA1_9PLEO|nr:hypothetical protein M011DRAFT_455337 [Sporormia fimetaria CBS 119925]